MMKRDGNLNSFWQDTAPLHLPLSKTIYSKMHFDAVVIGGGITGVTTALMLQLAGKKCLLLEANKIGFGTTAGTSAHLNSVLDTPYSDIIDKCGKEVAKKVAESASEAIQIIKQFVEKYKIECEFEEVKGYMYATDEQEEKELDKIYQSIKQVGLPTSYTSDIGAPIQFTKAIYFDQQARFHPLKYVQCLLDIYIKKGGRILENESMQNIEEEEGNLKVVGENFSFTAARVVHATHTYTGVNKLNFKLGPYRSYVLAVELQNPNDYPEGLIYDMKDPFHYLRKASDDSGDVLIVGGEDHKTGQEENPQYCFKNLEAFVRKHFAVKSIRNAWSSQYYESTDALPYIGALTKENPKEFIATGFSGNGMIFGTLSAKIISDLILTGESSYTDIYAPLRNSPIAGFKAFVSENVNVVKRLIGDRFKKETLEVLAALSPGEGKVVSYEEESLAIYKDESGKVYALDPVCKHAGCIVQWNNAEKSWDCPCHGARYGIDGAMLNGPARLPLDLIDLTEKK
jgi:glycine/D-amino acid oxidase-like deaminating enzyme/nitrite reductase/ring-hydroxylating ferredoxin subunit